MKKIISFKSLELFLLDVVVAVFLYANWAALNDIFLCFVLFGFVLLNFLYIFFSVKFGDEEITFREHKIVFSLYVFTLAIIFGCVFYLFISK